MLKCAILKKTFFVYISLFFYSSSVFSAFVETEEEKEYIQRSVRDLTELHLVNGMVMDIPEMYQIEMIFKRGLAAAKQGFVPTPLESKFTFEHSKKIMNITYFNYLKDYYIVDKDYDLVAYYLHDLCDLYEQVKQSECNIRYRNMVEQLLISRIITEKRHLNMNENISLSDLNFMHIYDSALNNVLKLLAEEII